MSFAYRVRDPLGNLLQGKLDAPSLNEATQQLRRDGYQVMEIGEAENDAGLAIFARRVRKRDLVYVTSQLAIMVDTGITISTALGAIVEQEENPTLRTLLEGLKARVEEGSNFSDALAQHPKHFDKTYVSLIRASEETGTMAEMLERIATYQQKELENRGKVQAALAYPILMLFLSIGVSIFLLTYIFPKFAPLFERKGAQLPLPTRLMMGVSNCMIHYWYLWLAAAVVVVAAIVASQVSERGKLARDWLQIRLPVLGPMMRKVIISRSIRTLGTMLSGGVSTLEALRICGDVSANRIYQQLWNSVLDKVMQGSAICAALNDTYLLPRTLVQMISAGEDTGRLDSVLEKVSVYYDKEVENAIKTATSLIEPILMCFMGVIIGTIALALMLPIFTLTKQH